MFDREQLDDVTCAQNIAPGNAVEVPLGFQPGVLIGFEIVIPDGHAYLTGIALGFAHGLVYPFGVGTFYEGNDDIIKRFVRDSNPGVAWSAFVYNQDAQSHAWQVRFMFDELGTAPTNSNTSTLTVADINTAAAAALTGP